MRKPSFHCVAPQAIKDTGMPIRDPHMVIGDTRMPIGDIRMPVGDTYMVIGDIPTGHRAMIPPVTRFIPEGIVISVHKKNDTRHPQI